MFTEDYINDLLYAIPDGAYDDILEDLELEEVPEERVRDMILLLESDRLDYRFRAALLLCNWGVKEGFLKLADLFVSGQSKDMIPHRLHPYDDTNTHILNAFISYWASFKENSAESEQARKDIFPYIVKMIQEASRGFYSIAHIDFLVESDKDLHKEIYKEYIPYLQLFLTVILNQPEENYWRIHDCILLLEKVGYKAFVNQQLQSKGKTRKDFIKESDEAFYQILSSS